MNIRPLSEELAEHDLMEAERMAQLQARYTAADRREGAWIEPHGRPAWPRRRCSPEAPPVIDRLREDYDAEDQSDSADADVLWFVVKAVLFLCAAFVLGALIDAGL